MSDFSRWPDADALLDEAPDTFLTPGGALEGALAAEMRPRLSPDGRWLAYSSNESGRFEVYVTFDPSRPRVIMAASGMYRDRLGPSYEIAPDGKKTLSPSPLMFLDGWLPRAGVIRAR